MPVPAVLLPSRLVSLCLPQWLTPFKLRRNIVVNLRQGKERCTKRA